MILEKKEYSLTRIEKIALLKNLDNEFKTRHMHYPITDVRFFTGIIEFENEKFKIDNLFTPWQRFIIPFAEGEFKTSENEIELLTITIKSPALQLFFSGIGTLLMFVFFLILSKALNAILLGIFICLVTTLFVIRSEKNNYQKRKQRIIEIIDELLHSNGNQQHI